MKTFKYLLVVITFVSALVTVPAKTSLFASPVATCVDCSHQQVINDLATAAGWIFLAEGRHANAYGKANDASLLAVQIPGILSRAEAAGCPGIADLWDEFNDLSTQLDQLNLDLADLQNTLDQLNADYDDALERLQVWELLTPAERTQLCTDAGLLIPAASIAYDEALDLFGEATALANAFQLLLNAAHEADCTVLPIPGPGF